ncbi:hypothetical protein JCM19233_3381 [Vibrio astriarenae]|nr:hypothetical protein JCM19233_3381 [Vibrio sp. C7]
MLATLLGGMLGVAIVLVRFAFRKEDEIDEVAVLKKAKPIGAT